MRHLLPEILIKWSRICWSPREQSGANKRPRAQLRALARNIILFMAVVAPIGCAGSDRPPGDADTDRDVAIQTDSDIAPNTDADNQPGSDPDRPAMLESEPRIRAARSRSRERIPRRDFI
jgi:hypothetical protein